MSYPRLQPSEAAPPGSEGAEAGARAFLADLSGRAELRAFAGEESPAPGVAGFAPGRPPPLFLPGLRLTGAQLFLRGFFSPDTPYPRLLVKWQTGAGKSIAAAAVAHEFARQARAAAQGGGRAPPVVVISFTARETLQEDLLRHPEFGFVTAAEVAELRRLRAAAGAAGVASAEVRTLAGALGGLRRRLTDRAQGGYYQFYGYKEFASRLFATTRAGAARGFDAAALYGRTEGAFGAALAAAVRRGDVAVDEGLLGELRGGLLIADEVHNAYNIQEKNNYGVAIQYALDALAEEAPRALFMSATPVTGSAAEVVDLLNLLVPRSALPGGAPLRRADFFAGGGGGEPLRLREDAAARIAHLAAGRVSFLLDADVGAYPRRVFEGDSVPGVPYLRLTLCPMAPYHERALAAEQGRAGTGPDAGLATGAHALYDMVFPNPAFAPDAAADPAADPAAEGLYRSGEVLPTLARAPAEWRAAAGVAVERVDAGPGASGAGPLLVSGAFLGPERLALYSTKYAALMAATLRALRGGPGKVLIYHHRVRTSGALLLQEALRMHGLADEEGVPTDATLCGACGAARGAHGAATHAYTPARFVVAHGAVDRVTMLRSIARYNAPNNPEGHQYRVLVGSRVVREGLNFRGVRHLFVASLPTDYPTLLQVFGRAVRKGSHADLPAAARDVRIRVFVSTRAGGGRAPELRRYADKGREFLTIQEVERALHAYAVDGFANYARVRRALHAGPGGEQRAGLDALPYSPVVGPGEGRARDATYLAYGHGEREVALIAAICRVLFRARPVWTYEDLWGAVRAGAVRGAGYDPAAFDEGNFALALEGLRRPAGVPLTVVARAGRFYVAAPVGPDGRPDLDVGCFLRAGPPPALARRSVRAADYVRATRAEANWGVHLRAFERAYLQPGGAPLELGLVEYGAAFHSELLRRLVEADAGADAGAPVTVDDARVREVYRRFRVAVTAADAAAPGAARALRGPLPAEPARLVGFLTPDAVSLYEPAARRWYSAGLADFGVGRRHDENEILVGFVGAARGPGAGAGARLKLRAPVAALAARAKRPGDLRGLARGAVCETRPLLELKDYWRRLSAAAAAAGLAPASAAGAAEGGTAPALCGALRALLLALEAHARAAPGGMQSGTRWLYLFHDRPPSAQALTRLR